MEELNNKCINVKSDRSFHARRAWLSDHFSHHHKKAFSQQVTALCKAKISMFSQQLGSILNIIEAIEHLIPKKDGFHLEMLIHALLVALLVVSCSGLLGIGRKQSAGVRGILMCDGKPASDVEVKLYDDDRGIDTDDLLAHGKTDSEGKFELKGYTHEITTIDPKVNIYHDCDDLITPCQRKLSIMLPDKYVSAGETPEQYYNVGILELSGTFKGETRDCIH
uniref:Uncharacterized protein n=1 Tax=Ditylenchus dipsaci TaxID=166011 RepID=A0A915EG94_9BILA